MKRFVSILGAAIPPLCIALSRTLSIFALNYGAITLADILRSLILIALGVAGVFGLAQLLFARDPHRSSLWSGLFWGLFFSFGRLDAVLTGRLPALVGHLVASVLVLGVLAGAVLLLRRVKDPKPAFQIVAVGSVALLATNAFTIVQVVAKARQIVRTQITSPLPPDASVPDIYYLVLDSYGRRDMLQRLYHYDNGPFVTALERKGFVVPTQNHANYTQTKFSLPSILNMEYIETLTQGGQAYLKDSVWSRALVTQNRLMTFLRPYHYRFAVVTTGYAETEPLTADVLYSPLQQGSLGARLVSPPSHLEHLILDRTPLRAFVRADQAKELSQDVRRQSILDAFRRADELISLPGRKVVYTHILSPHPPFLFDRDGKARDLTVADPLSDANELVRQIGQENYLRYYTEQLEFINGKVLTLIDAIQAKASKPYVIVIVGDHGPRSQMDFNDETKTNLDECFPNLIAVCDPAMPKGTLPESVSLVNLFRVVLNTHFQTNLPLLPNRYFFVRNDTHQAVDVTERTKSE